MAYCTSAQVRATVHTELTDAQITEYIVRSDAWVDLMVDEASLSAAILEELSLLRSAYRIMMVDPASFRLGDYSEDRGATFAALKKELDDMITATGGGTVFEVGYDPIDIG